MGPLGSPCFPRRPKGRSVGRSPPFPLPRQNKLGFAVPSPGKRKSSTWSAPDAKDDGEDVDGDDDEDVDGDDDDEDVEDDNDSDNSHKVFAQLNGRSDGGAVGRADGRTDGRTVGRLDGRSD